MCLKALLSRYVLFVKRKMYNILCTNDECDIYNCDMNNNKTRINLNY